ncbi:MAG: GAF domain-containing protein [Proteobacteria bacterium]|nr:GAF domain-containing protein [Pseudomonadota bacterium]
MSDEFEVCLAENGDYYVRNNTAISEIVHNVREGRYCAILGPPYSQKSLLLNDVKAQLGEDGDKVCVLVNLHEIGSVADEDFWPVFAAILNAQLEQIQVVSRLSPENVADERSLQRFLQNCAKSLNRDLVLLLDHLERLRIGPLRSLLRVLRAVYNERDANAPYRLSVVTTNSLSIAALALGPTSPFNMAHIVLVQDLTLAESGELVDCIVRQKGIKITAAGRQRCFQATHGDRYLLTQLCTRCVELSVEASKKQVTKREVEQAITWFMDKQAAQHQPLQETIRAIEADSIDLMNILKILEQGQSPRRDLRLDLKVEKVDDLQLTGAVRSQVVGEQQVYMIRNEIYEHYLKQHFHPERVAYVLSRLRKWDEAIRYLAHLVVQYPEHGSTLMDTIISFIYAAGDESKAYAHLAPSLSRVFPNTDIRIYLVDIEQPMLTLVSQSVPNENVWKKVPLVGSPGFGQDNDYIVAQGIAGKQVLLIPLLWDDEELGLVAIHGFDTYPLDNFQKLLAFLRQTSRAIGTVVDRKRELRQLAILNETGKKVTRSLDLDHVLHTTVEAAIEAVPAAQKGSIFLWDEDQQKLVIHAPKGFRDDIVDVMKLDKGEGYAGWVYNNREPLRVSNVLADPRAAKVDHPDIKKRKSAICVPLEAWGRVIGVLCLDNMMTCDAFRESDLELLGTFGTQASIAIQNAHLHTELYTLGITINDGALNPKQIFKKVVGSITRVSDAKAANMLLLRDTDDPELSVSQKPVLSVSGGMGRDYDEKVHPRPNGLTFRVLQDKRPCWVSYEPDDSKTRWTSNLKESPRINKLAWERDTRAYLCLPLILKSIIGVLFVHYDKPHDFSANEIEMLSLFANQAALAIENAQQREELMMTKAVAWMGIVFSSLAHRITQKAGAIRNTVWGLRQSLERLLVDEEQSSVIERLDRIDEYARTVREIPGRALLPSHDPVDPLDLNDTLRQEIPKWCSTDDDIALDFSKLTSDNTVVCADLKWLRIVFELLTTNAVQAMSGSTHKELIVLSQVRGQRVVVEITNTGKKISENVRARLFKEPIPKDKGKTGSGVGLLIARTIMRRYGGDIELVRTGPEGTTFSLWLPQHSASN